jgi:hypothetical protein
VLITLGLYNLLLYAAVRPAKRKVATMSAEAGWMMFRCRRGSRRGQQQRTEDTYSVSMKALDALVADYVEQCHAPDGLARFSGPPQFECEYTQRGAVFYPRR